jgi:hypothetical protein
MRDAWARPAGSKARPIEQSVSEPFKHHQPVFYLKGWCGPDRKVVRNWRPNGREVKASPIAPKNTGFEPRLYYSLEGFPEDQQQVIEKEFFKRVVDDPAAPALKVLIARDQLTWEQRVAWTCFLMAALARSPDMIKKIQNEGRRNMEEALLREASVAHPAPWLIS